MRIRVINTLDDLADDTRAIAVRARGDMIGVVRDGIRVGNSIAKENAKRTAGKHGKLYPRAFSAEMTLFGALGLIAGEYGPDASMPQGGMEFEDGSRNQPPHRDLAKSADVIGPSFAGEVRRLPDRWFW